MLPTVTDQEAFLRRVLAILSRCPETDPVVREAAAHFVTVIEQGGEVTLTFKDHRMIGLVPAVTWQLSPLQAVRGIRE